MRNAASFIDFDADSMTLSIEADKTDKQTQPIFDIRIILTDDHPRDPLSRSYDFTIIIVKDWTDPIETLLEDAQKSEVIFDYGTEVYDLTESSVDKLIEANPLDNFQVDKYRPILSTTNLSQQQGETIKTEQDAPAPQPTITGMTNDGVVTIRFNQLMKIPNLRDI